MARYAGRREVLAALVDPQSDDSTMGVPEGVLPPDLLLGKATSIPSAYAPDVLVPILRSIARAQLGVELADFEGLDRWEAPEVSWLDMGGKPEVACGEFRVSADSRSLIESKSLKLYLNSLNQERFQSREQVRSTIVRDLSVAAGSEVEVELRPLNTIPDRARGRMPGTCIDELGLGESGVPPAAERIEALHCTGEEVLQETLCTHLFRSLCPVTSQPDWASIALHYRGPRIDRVGLLRYWVSYRTTQAFHESCVERMFSDLGRACRPEWMHLDARFALRGGLAIHPLRKSLQAP